MTSLTRRTLGLSLGGAAALGLTTGTASATVSDQSFPAGFKWGSATAAYQIEGAVDVDGRGRSNWDVFSHTEGKVANGDTGDVACDSYRRYREDTQLLKGLGANAYRFSIAWSRIFPTGRGRPNRRGVDHYKRVVDDLLENGIEPYVTLFHWDLPVGLEGGWQSRDTAEAFADYAGYMAHELSDRVHHFMTVNEIRSFVDAGHLIGIHAPGLRLRTAEFNQVRHNALLAHGLGVQAIRARARTGTKVGLAENPTLSIPVTEAPADIEAAKRAMRRLNYGYLATVLEGTYAEGFMNAQSAPRVEANDMAAIGSALDFVGINVYGPTSYVRADPNAASGYEIISTPRSFPRMVLDWLRVAPESAYWVVRLIGELWSPQSIFITENGCPSDDRLVNGRVHDPDRIMYLRNYLTHLRRAIQEGYPVHGYFLWSLLDNFEWAEGYSKRFGIHYVDFETQQRTRKLSAEWYSEVIRRNGLA